MRTMEVIQAELATKLREVGMLLAEYSHTYDASMPPDAKEREGFPADWFPAGWYENITDGAFSDEHAGCEIIHTHGGGRSVMEGVREFLLNLGFTPK